MADTKITALTAISTIDLTLDVLPIVDTSDTGMALTGTTKKVTTNQLLGAGGTASFGTLTVTGASTLTGAATVQGLTMGKGTGAAASNTAFGVNVLAARTTGVAHTGVGVNALAAVTTADSCTAVGNGALQSLTTGLGNVAVGGNCLYNLLAGATNTAIGVNCLISATGSDNVSSGYRSLTSLAAGNENTAYGTNAGDGQTSGSNNAFFGFGSYGDSNTASHSYNYGNGSVATHKFRAGDVVVNTGNVVIGTSAKGIDFSATANSSGNLQTSELLADYEEGTWVPTDTSGAGLAITGTYCKYTKIGRAVTIQGTIVFPSTANAAASRIGGLPFVYADIAPMNISYIPSATIAFFMGFYGNSDLEFYNLSAGATTNAALSGLSVRFFGTYYI